MKYTHFHRDCKLFKTKPCDFDRICPMFDEDLDPKKKKQALKNLEPMSLDELTAYIQSMEAEMVRVKAEIERKKAYLNAAATFFKS